MLSTPLHPLLVHFPIALLFLGAITEIIALFKKDFFDKASLYLIGTGFITGIFAYLTGDGAEHYAEAHQSNEIDSIVHTHETFALTTLIIFGVYLVLKLWKFWKKLPQSFSYLLTIITIAGAITLSITGHYGGKMVYPDHQTSNQQVTHDDDD
ncbi:DUF2231 domain-containing protein [Halobacillus rhizosphaerae]|uniref:DUF2231 domain-containing protein n=1 Tax=Halobacillus rhizosphaerae TaxID=3064889 RepID=UPI00398B3A50